MDDERQRVLAANQAVFREINEGISRGQWPGEEAASASFRCECASLGCTALVELSVRDYERIRANPRQFVVATGHAHEDVESVVAVEPAYVVVEKRDEAGAIAEATDPRG